MSTSHTYTLPQFAKALKRMDKNVREKAMSKAVMAGGTVVEAEAKINIITKFNHPTGLLAASMMTRLESSGGNHASVEVGPTAIYGRIQELGGTIKPLVKKMLHWVDEHGKHHQAYQVTLPARPYLAPAVHDNEKKIIGAMSEILLREIEGSI